MCDQTEIRYLDGDVVWVKLGPCWWPGQVTGVDNLPEDLKVDFNKKPPIAAVKFFQENSYEFVKNIHQIYKYNCTQKDDFIKKGLDKYRTKHKNGSKLMDKFPGDVETAETLTGGDPSILKSEKFSPEEKPDISALFGDKKSPKKKQKPKEAEMTRRSYTTSPKLPRPLMLRESDHEVRIRHQPSSHPTTPTSGVKNTFSCPLCSFRTTRVNVLICHNKSHREPPVDVGLRHLLSPPKRRSLGDEPQKRKYVRKNKSLPRLKNDRASEPVKRKQKQAEKITKKKKADPEINELLADWDDGSDDMEVDMNKSTPMSSPSTKDRKLEDDEDSDLLKESEKLLKETESLSTHLENSKTKPLEDPLFDEGILKPEPNKPLDDEEEMRESSSLSVRHKSSKPKSLNDSGGEELAGLTPAKDLKKKTFEEAKESENSSIRLKNSKGKLENDSHPEAGLSLPVVKEKSALSKKLRKSLGERKNSTPENDEEKKSKLSCFDFDDEEPEPAFPPVRKITRVFGEKNTSLKKEIIKEFVLSQALAEEKEAESKANQRDSKNEEKLMEEEVKNMEDDEKLRQDITKTVDEASALVAKIASETERSTELEIVEILEVEREKEPEEMKPDDEKMEESVVEGPAEPEAQPEVQPELQPEPEPKTLDNHKSPKRFPSKSPGKSPRKSPSKSPMRSPKKLTPTSSPAKSESLPKDPKDLEDVDTNPGKVTIESEEETLTISQLSNAGSGDGVEMGWNQLSEMIGDKSSTESPSVDSPQPKPAEKPVKRRGRPRKYPLQTDVSGNGDSSTKFEEPQLPGTPDSHETERKTSESDGERLSTGRRRKPNKRYLESDIYSSSPGRRTPRTDDSQSETEEKEPKVKGRRGRKPSAISKAIRKSLEEYEFSDQTLDSAEEAGVSTPIPKSPVKSPEFTSGRTDVMSPVNITDLLATSDVEIKSPGFGSLETDRELKIVETRVKTSETAGERREEEDERKIEMLPPKKSQIKKFEMSQIDAQESPNIVSKAEEETKVEPVEEMKPEVSNEIVEEERVSEVITTVVGMETETADGIVENIVEETIENIIIEEVIETKETIVEAVTPEPEEESVEVTTPAVETTESPDQVLEGISEKLKGLEEPKVPEEAEAPEEPEAREELNVPEESKVLEEPRAPEEVKAPEEPAVPEIPEELKTPEEPKVLEEPGAPEQSKAPEVQPISTAEEEIPPEVTPTEVPAPPEEAPDDTSVPPLEHSISSPAPEASNSVASPQEPRSPKKSPVKSSPAASDVSVPVKKREKPRIIENVALREPMQILKSKLLEKQPTKGTKHKLDIEASSRNEISGNPRTKIMKLDTSKSNSSSRNPGLSLTKKLQVLKAGEALELQQDKLNLNTISISSSGGSDPSEVEFDLNSIPFVMSEDLTPENIEQMPVIMSSIISTPSSSVMTTALTLATATTQIPSNQVQFKPTMTATETMTPEKAPAKKKTASPTILKAKPKAKPTITSIKTLVPPLTGGVKGLKFQGQQGTKTMPVLATPKGSPGKYVIVQTGIGGQPVRHTVQGTIAMPQKMPIPSAKPTLGNVQPQIVQQGNKVVILTSPASGQTKMVPLAVQKTLASGKVQKLMTNKGQVLGKTIIAPKSDPSSPTTSKIAPSGQKIVNTGVLSKGVFTTISGGKAVLGTLPQHFVTAKGVITQINTSQLSGKAVVGQKTYITNKGSFYPITSQGGAKTLLTPISQSSLAGKTIITSAGLVPGKGAVLTPFTGQQVKAMAAKGTPGKGGKIYQQLPMVQKKVPMSPGSTVQRGGAIKSPGTIVIQNPPPLHQTGQTPGKITPKKIIRQTVMSPLSPQPGKSVAPQTLQRSKSVMTGTPQKGRQAKQKIVIQKVAQETPPRGATTIVKTPVQKTTVSTAAGGIPGTNRIVRGQPTVKNIQQQLSAVATSASPVITTAVGPEALVEDKKSGAEVARDTKQVEASASTSTPPTEPVKQEEPKVAAPQIMALPTESADGSQTYVLVTIDEQGQIQPLDNNALMSLEGTTPNADGSRTLYIDPSSLDPSGAIDNIVLQFDNTSVSTLPQSNPPEVPQTVSEGFQTSNQDILAAALANTDFQQEIGLPETTVPSVMATGITQTSLDTQTILQSTLIPSAEPISSPSVLETSLTLNQPIMTPLEVPSSIGIQSDVTDAAPVSSMASLEIPISISNPTISYIAAPEGILPGNSMPDIGELIETPEAPQVQNQPASQYLVIPDMQEGIDRQETTAETPACTISYAVTIPENVILESGHVQTTPSMPLIDDSFVDNVEYPASRQTPPATAEELIKSNSEEEVQTQEESTPPETSEVTREPTQVIVRDMPIVQTDEPDHTSSAKHPEGDDNASNISSCVEEAPASSETKPPEPDVESSSAFEAEPVKQEEHSSKIEDEPEPMETDSVPEIQVSPPVAQSSQPEPMDVDYEKTEPASQDTVDTVDERPSQSFEKFESLSINNDEVISQSTSKSEGTEATQSSPYESMEMETTVAGEPPTQSFEDARGASGASVSQSSYEASSENTNAPTQSFNEVRASDEAADDPSFPTQSYEVGNADNLVESLETDGEISQEGNIPSQSNDVGNEGIGTSGFSNNSGLNEDETASSSYVPETPETQERDQDQESAISTSSYEIPPCEDINIATSSVIADTSVDTGSLHDNGVPEIPTSSYNLNPDSSSTHVDAVPTSSFEDQVVVEQNVSTSYEVPISMPRLEGDSAQNFVSESSDQRNEPTSYYARNPEEVTSEASQSYLMPEGPSPSYPTQTVSPSCYEAPPETEASQSYYSTQEIDRTEQSSSRNVEASPSFYQDTTDEVRLRSQGEATPTYTERYPLDYTLDNSPIERHDLVESSVPATKPTER